MSVERAWTLNEESTHVKDCMVSSQLFWSREVTSQGVGPYSPVRGLGHTHQSGDWAILTSQGVGPYCQLVSAT